MGQNQLQPLRTCGRTPATSALAVEYPMPSGTLSSPSFVQGCFKFPGVGSWHQCRYSEQSTRRNHTDESFQPRGQSMQAIFHSSTRRAPSIQTHGQKAIHQVAALLFTRTCTMYNVQRTTSNVLRGYCILRTPDSEQFRAIQSNNTILQPRASKNRSNIRILFYTSTPL